MRRTALRAISVGFAVLLFGVTGCSGEDPGTAIPAGSTTAEVSSAEPGAPSSEVVEGEASIEPCSLLTASEIAPVGDFEEPTEEQIGAADSCVWDPDQTDASLLPTVALGVRENAVVDELRDRGNGVHKGTMEGSGREVALSQGDHGCTVAMAVGDGARVDAVVTGIDGAEACDLAEQIAEIVDPKLPGGN